jgi:RHS repeat-associated protein
MNFVFNGATGNLTSRTGMITNVTESFEYDNLDRLKNVKHNSSYVLQMDYAPNGNITYKNGQNGLGAYKYEKTNGAGPHALTEVEEPYNTNEQIITYNAFNKAKKIIDGGYEYNIMYGPDQQRWKTELKYNGGSTILKKVLYAGDYEEIHENNGAKKRQLIYLPGGVMHVTQNGQGEMFYAHKDHLGSILKITKGDGTNVFTAQYDAWGNRTTYTYNAQQFFLFHRGYTGHEHLPEFGLINMNGRMYDPIVGRFLSPDPYVQAPGFSQAFNRYSYCWNNPLIYTDPSGEIIFTALAAIFYPPLIPIAIFADVFSTGNVVTQAMAGNIRDVGDFFHAYGQGALVGAAIGATWYYSGPAGLAGQTGLLGPWQYGLKVAGAYIHTSMNVYGIAQGVMGLAGIIGGGIDDCWSGAGRAGKLFLGNFYLDNNFFGGIWKGYMRHAPWERINTLAGQSYLQIRNMSHLVDRVEYNAGVTYAVTENVTGDQDWWGVSLGNFSAVKLRGSFTDFDTGDFWHEFGHTIASRSLGPFYLPVMLLCSATEWGLNWSGEWTENWANRYSERYRRRNKNPF